jgi:hypothetical protein
MTLGYARTLSAREQQLVATWGFKTALMLDLVDDPVIPLGFYRRFALERRPPNSSVVWLGAYLGSKAVIAYRQPLQFDAPLGELPKALVSTFTAYRVIFQVFQHFARGSAELNGERHSAHALHQIWPSGPAVAWPRGRLGFNDDALRELAGSINDAGAA